MRHAEAAPQAGGTDHARRLTAKGRNDARAMATRLEARGWVPSRIYASDSARTRETADELLAVLRPAPPVAWAAALYLGGLEALVDALRDGDAAAATVLVLGHNPGFSEAAGLLAGRPASLGTAHAALLSIDAEGWAEATALAGSWTLAGVVTP